MLVEEILHFWALIGFANSGKVRQRACINKSQEYIHVLKSKSQKASRALGLQGYIDIFISDVPFHVFICHECFILTCMRILMLRSCLFGRSEHAAGFID